MSNERKAGKTKQSAARGQRLSAALRENLKRRKAQARARATGPSPKRELPQDAAGIEAKTPDFRRNRGNE